MVATLYSGAVLVDTSAVLALLNRDDRHHQAADTFFGQNRGAYVWIALNATSHEAFTRSRYDSGSVAAALERYDFLRQQPLKLIEFTSDDEAAARKTLAKYEDQVLSYHDALCAAVMLRLGLFKVFSFDHHFWVLGFEVLPGNV